MLHSTPAYCRGFTRPIFKGRTPAPTKKEIVTGWSWFENFLSERGDLGRKQYDLWEKRRGKTENWPELMDGFRKLEHRILYKLNIVDVDNAIAKTTHSLGNLEKSCSKFDNIHNYSPPVPLIYIFHSILEKLGRVPLWNDVQRYLFGEMRSLCWIPFCKSRNLDPSLPVITHDKRILDAFQWRIGNAYYSWLREIDLLTYLRRKHKLDLRYHFLVDAEWRADFVAGRIMLELYIKNREFKDDGSGRKLTCAKMNEGYKVLPIKMDVRPAFGKPWLVSDKGKGVIARELMDNGCPLIA